MGGGETRVHCKCKISLCLVYILALTHYKKVRSTSWKLFKQSRPIPLNRWRDIKLSFYVKLLPKTDTALRIAWDIYPETTEVGIMFSAVRLNILYRVIPFTPSFCDINFFLYSKCCHSAGIFACQLTYSIHLYSIMSYFIIFGTLDMVSDFIKSFLQLPFWSTPDFLIFQHLNMTWVLLLVKTLKKMTGSGGRMMCSFF